MRLYEVYIFDEESGCCQPIRCEAKNTGDAKRIGNKYIRTWKLVGGIITDIREVEA